MPPMQGLARISGTGAGGEHERLCFSTVATISSTITWAHRSFIRAVRKPDRDDHGVPYDREWPVPPAIVGRPLDAQDDDVIAEPRHRGAAGQEDRQQSHPQSIQARFPPTGRSPTRAGGQSGAAARIGDRCPGPSTWVMCFVPTSASWRCSQLTALAAHFDDASRPQPPEQTARQVAGVIQSPDPPAPTVKAEPSSRAL